MKLSGIIIILFFAINYISHAQKLQNFEKKNAFEFKERISFYKVNNRYDLQKDTIFYSFPGFRVFPSFDTITIDDNLYAVFEYPSFTGKSHKQKSDTTKNKVEENKNLENVSNNPVRISILNRNRMFIAMPYDLFKASAKDTLYNASFTDMSNFKITSGILTVPFKLRSPQKDENFTMTTDVTLGPYIGVTKRISSRNPIYVTLPVTLGLAFINISNNETATVNSEPNINTVPGVSWSSGLIFQLNKFDIGFVFGQDFASDIGDNWIYQGKTWTSFAIGYSFSKPSN